MLIELDDNTSHEMFFLCTIEINCMTLFLTQSDLNLLACYLHLSIQGHVAFNCWLNLPQLGCPSYE